MMEKDYVAFNLWYETQKVRDDWNFKDEMKKYCVADVVLLGKCLLKFRKLFKDSLDVDPFRYVTLSSLCMSVYTHMFMPLKQIVGNATDKNISMICKEWLNWLEDEGITPEYPIFVNTEKYDKFDRHTNKVNGVTEEYYKTKHCFTVDGYNENTNTVLEMNGCYFHGCRKCYPENVMKYNKTMERKNIY